MYQEALMEAECHSLESTSIRRHNMLLTFSNLENFRKKPQWELEKGIKPPNQSRPRNPLLETVFGLVARLGGEKLGDVWAGGGRP